MEGLVLGRIGHYFDASYGSCSTAIVVDAAEDVGTEASHTDMANVAAWNRDGMSFSRTSVPVNATPSIEDTRSSFHLNRDCPWGR
jgi:hypothetical protein